MVTIIESNIGTKLMIERNGNISFLVALYMQDIINFLVLLEYPDVMFKDYNAWDPQLSVILKNMGYRFLNGYYTKIDA